MSKKATCLKVPKIYGEKAVASVNKLKLVNRELEVKRNAKFIHIPLARKPSKSELEKLEETIPTLKVSTSTFQEKKKVKTFTEVLGKKLSPHLLVSLPRAIDFVGDIAIIEIPPELEAHKMVIGEAILKTNRKARTVLAKASAISGTYRLREFDTIAGEPKTETIHKEYGCQYYVDIAKTYFSPRLSHEHNRVASLVKDGETVVDLFAGVGPFAVLIAKKCENVKVYAVDVNPDAVRFLEKNIRLNRVERKVYPILGDARKVVEERLSGVADRVIMNLPEKALEYVASACKSIKHYGGTVHFYGFVNTSNSLEQMTARFTDAVKKPGRKVEKMLFSRFVRATAPYEWQAVLDAEIR